MLIDFAAPNLIDLDSVETSNHYYSRNLKSPCVNSIPTASYNVYAISESANIDTLLIDFCLNLKKEIVHWRRDTQSKEVLLYQMGRGVILAK